MKLVTHDTFVDRLCFTLHNPHLGEVVWKGKTYSYVSYDELKEIALELLEDSDAVLHIRKPGPKTVHYVGRPDIKANGKECIEVCY